MAYWILGTLSCLFGRGGQAPRLLRLQCLMWKAFGPLCLYGLLDFKHSHVCLRGGGRKSPSPILIAMSIMEGNLVHCLNMAYWILRSKSLDPNPIESLTLSFLLFTPTHAFTSYIEVTYRSNWHTNNLWTCMVWSAIGLCMILGFRIT